MSFFSVSGLSNDSFSNEECVSIGCIRREFVDFLNSHGLDGVLKYDTPILFWKDRIEHTEAHKNDFSSDTIYKLCFEEIPQIIHKPDYISVHPQKKSISFIKDYSSNHVNVAIRVTISGTLSYRTMYPLIDATLTHYIDTMHAWQVIYDANDIPTIIDNTEIQ